LKVQNLFLGDITEFGAFYRAQTVLAGSQAIEPVETRRITRMDRCPFIPVPTIDLDGIGHCWFPTCSNLASLQHAPSAMQLLRSEIRQARTWPRAGMSAVLGNPTNTGWCPLGNGTSAMVRDRIRQTFNHDRSFTAPHRETDAMHRALIGCLFAQICSGGCVNGARRVGRRKHATCARACPKLSQALSRYRGQRR